MWRWARWVVVGLVVAGAWLAWYLHTEAVQRSACNAVYEAKLDQLRKIYLVGTPRGEIVQRLGQQSTQIEAGQVEMFLGKEKTGGWVCSEWDSYARFVFGNADTVDAEPLVRIQKRGSGICL